MSTHTVKKLSERDGQQTLQGSFNDVNSTIGVDGFIVGLVGRRIDVATTTTNVSGDSQTFTFSENGTQLYTLLVVYTDNTQQTLLYVQRTA
jgi:hypothetical protein